ncbi:MAG: regulator of sigma E protease, partial [Candidatus Paceibacteria bacterium]
MDLTSLWHILQVVLGVGLVIFVHEFGHFIAARLCGVRVVVFSLGFGPRLLHWRRGETEYQIAAVPLGGYVRMAGEETHYSDTPAAEDELGSKTVGQRFFIYSAGVIMNVVFGLVVFPVLLYAGIPSAVPVVGQVTPGSPAWKAGLAPGMRVLTVNEEEIYDLNQILPEVAHGGAQAARLTGITDATGEPFALEIVPIYNDQLGMFSIGQVLPEWAVGFPLTVLPDSAAAKAGVLTGDLLLGVNGSTPGLDPAQQLVEAMRRDTGFEVRVERVGVEHQIHLEPQASP